MKALLRLDRRVIYLLVAVAMIVPLVRPLRFPGLSVTDPVRRIYDRIEAMPPGANLLVSFDFDPSSKPELEPQARAILRHAFRRKLDVVAVGLWVTGKGLAQQVLEDCAKEAGAVYGEDYAYLGWQPGGSTVVIGMGQDISKTFPKDARGGATADLPIMRDIKILKDMHYAVAFGAGDPGIEVWVVYGRDKYGFEMAGGTTSINAAPLSPYLQTGQLHGLINGLKGAAEYEALIGKPALATGGLDSMVLGALLVTALVLLANIAALASKGAGR